MSINRQLMQKCMKQKREAQAYMRYAGYAKATRKVQKYRLKSNFDGVFLEWEGTMEEFLKDFGATKEYQLVPIAA